MNYVLIAGVIAFAAWTAGVGYFATQYGKGRGDQACQAERDAAIAGKDELQREHATSAKQYEEDRKNDQTLILALEQKLDELAKSRPVPVGCRLGPDRMRLWNEANAGGAVPGEPADPVRPDLRGAPNR